MFIRSQAWRGGEGARRGGVVRRLGEKLGEEACRGEEAWRGGEARGLARRRDREEEAWRRLGDEARRGGMASRLGEEARRGEEGWRGGLLARRRGEEEASRGDVSRRD
eukprot:7388769-Prymnesium_polylepis.1